MEVLQALECQDYVFFGIELLSFLTEHRLEFEIFLEVIIAEVFVDLQLVVELLHGLLVGFPLVGGFGCGHFANQFELSLYLFHTGECAVHIVGVG